MFKSAWLFLIALVSVHAQVLTGRPGNPVAKTYSISAQILDEGSFQLQRSGAGLTNWAVVTNFNTMPGTNGFTDTITNQQRFYRVTRLTQGAVLTNQPIGVTNFYNEEVRLEAGATGSWPIRYFWFKDGSLVPAASNNVLSFPGRTNLNGNYTFAASNDWGIAMSTPVPVKTVNPVTPTITGKKFQHVIRGAQGSGIVSSGSFETTYTSLGYNTTSSNFNLNDSGQWQYAPTAPNVGQVRWLAGGFVYPNGANIDLTFTNTTAGTYNLQTSNGRQFGEFRIVTN